MATWHTSRCFGAIGLLVALAGCVGDGYLESVTTIESICTDEARLAVLVAVFVSDDRIIDSVTATNESEQQCFLESASRGGDAQDAGEPSVALYSCWEQAQGNYEVRVTSGEQTWTQSVDVPGDGCHVSERQKLKFELK
jgi:hypothetical protein